MANPGKPVPVTTKAPVLALEPGTAEITPDSAESGPRWTFLTNHTHVLILLARNPDMVLRQVAQAIGITERAVQRIVQELVEGEFLGREKLGRNNHYRIMPDRPLRHPIEAHRKIGDLLDLINRK